MSKKDKKIKLLKKEVKELKAELRKLKSASPRRRRTKLAKMPSQGSAQTSTRAEIDTPPQMAAAMKTVSARAVGQP